MKVGATFNWTKVELKQEADKPGEVVRNAFNWTKVELKQIYVHVVLVGIKHF